MALVLIFLVLVSLHLSSARSVSSFLCEATENCCVNCHVCGRQCLNHHTQRFEPLINEQIIQFLDGTEKIPAYCQRFNPNIDLSDVDAHYQRSIEWELLIKEQANQTSEYIRIGCPAPYDVFGNKHCIDVNVLEQYKKG